MRCGAIEHSLQAAARHIAESHPSAADRAGG